MLAFDAPARGQSSGKVINAPTYKNMVREIPKLFGPIESYMAHSFGGLDVCLALEEIKHTANYRLALIAPATGTTTAIDTFFSFLKLNPEIRLEFDKIIIKKSDVSPAWFSIKRAMKLIRAKVLWVHDEDNDVTPLSDAMKVKDENYLNIEFVITKGVGHRRIYLDNKVTQTITNFL